MTKRDHRHLESWLTAESAGRSEDADRALAALFAMVPRLAPGAGFADRVLRRAGLTAPARSLARPVRWLVAASVALIAAFAGVLPSLAPWLAERTSFVGVVDATSGGIVTVAGWLRGSLVVWDALSGISSAVATTAATPPVALALLAALAAAGLALRLLSDLLANEGSWTYARTTR